MGSWLGYVAMTVVCWGLYGIFLHQGAMGMADPVHGRVKAFLFVGLAYFLVAVLAPAALLLAQGASWDLPAGGATWSLIAGTVGAVGAFGVLLAFGAKGTPAVVMTLVFAGAPLVNAVVGVTKAGQWGEVRWQFLVGVALAVIGGGLVTLYKPSPAPHAPVVPSADAPTAEG